MARSSRTLAAVASIVSCASVALATPASAVDGSPLQTLINQDRAANGGLPPLAWSACLGQVAQQNAQRIANQGYLSHTDGPTVDLGCGVGATSAGENVAYISGGIDDNQVNTMYMNSPGHRANILGTYTFVATAWVVAPNGYAYNAEEFLNAPSLVPTTQVTWSGLGGSLTSGPGASGSGSQLDVFARGTDNALWHRSFDGTGWSGWQSLGGQLTADPAAVSWAAGRIDVFVRGTDGAIWHRTFSNATWSGWESLGGFITSAPAASSWGSGRLDVFARGGDSALWHRAYTAAGWTGWESLGGAISGSPAAASQATGNINVFGRGTDNAIWHRPFSGTWGPWQSLGGSVASAPAAASWGPGRVDVFAVGMDNGVWHRWFNTTAWSGWQSLGGQATADPAAVSTTPGKIDVFIRGTDQGLWHAIISS